MAKYGEKVFLYNNPPPPAMRRAVAGGRRRRRTPRTAPSLALRLVRGYSFSCPQGAFRPDFQSRFVVWSEDVFNPSVTIGDSSPICAYANTEEQKVTYAK